MASIDINIGSSADDGTGDNLRTFATNVAAMFAEIYGLGTAESDLTTGTAFEITNARIATNAAIDMDKLDGDSLAGSLTDFAQDDLVILSDTSDSGNLKNMTTSNLEDSIFGNVSGDATIAAGGALTIANDSVEHSMLENRYTAQASITTLTGTVAFDCSTASNFKLSGDLTGAYTINLSNYKKGQIITIFPLKAQSITLAAQGSSTNTFNKIGGVDYDNSTASILQIECVDDSSTDAIFFYSIATFASDNTP